MGEAKRRQAARQDALASGKPFKPDPECPACRSRRVGRLNDAEIMAAFGCEIELCADCRAIWEAFPANGYVEDPVCSDPCDNCAFRPGSPEQADPEKWRELIASLRPDGNGWFKGQFFCHKGVPIDMSKGPGNFLFPQKAFDVDGASVMGADTSRMRTCSGFLRMFWALNAKGDAHKPLADAEGGK